MQRNLLLSAAGVSLLVATIAGAVGSHAHLELMKSQYTTDEQRRIHDGLEAEAVAPQSATFF